MPHRASQRRAVARAEEDLAHLEPGDIVLLATDGLYECANRDGELFGTARVAEAVSEASGLPAAEIAAHLLARLDAFAAGVPIADDITFLIVVHR